MASQNDLHILQDFQIMYPNMLQDAAKWGLPDVSLLVRQLETWAKKIALVSGTLDSASSDVQFFITNLINAFVNTWETAKLANSIEKVLRATGTGCDDLIKALLREKLLNNIEHVSVNGKNFRKLSAALEHSKLVQELMPDYVTLLLKELSVLFKKLLVVFPNPLSRQESENFHCAVKLSLQLFHTFTELQQQGWLSLQRFTVEDATDTDLDQDPSDVAVVINGILSVLARKSYSREVTLLAGTVISMVIKAAPTSEHAALCILSVHSILTKGAVAQQLTDLHLDSTPNVDSLTTCPNRIPEIALLSSIISASSQSVLCCEVQNSNGNAQILPKEQALLLNLFPMVCELCDAGTEFQYLSFHLLSIWVQKLSSCSSDLTEQQKYQNLMGKDSIILKETLKRVWVSLDSPVDGVTEFVTDTLKTLLEVWHAEVKNGRSDYPQLAEDMMLKALQVPWYARSRYKPLSLLVPYVDTGKLLLERATLKQELLDCMGVSFLAALAADVYTAFLNSIKNSYSKEEQAQIWMTTWLPTIVSGLTDSDRQLKNKVCAYWLTSTLKVLPESGSLLQNNLQDKLQTEEDQCLYLRLLFSWVAVCKNIRTVTGLDLNTLPEQLLTEAVYSNEEDICAEALALLSTTQKKAELFGDFEIRLLKAALPYCLKVDSAPFRLVLVTSLRKVFVRIRDSCSTAINRKAKADFVDSSLQFVEWLYQLMMTNLFPGASFQRNRTCVDLIQALLETVIFIEADGAKKGKAKNPTDSLIKFAQSKGLWDFFSSRNRLVLLHCITDNSDEIQGSAFHILRKYFPWPLAVSSSQESSQDLTLAIHLLNSGLELCHSPRPFENHSGALLIRLVYEKFVREQGLQFNPQEDQTNSPFSALVSTSTHDAEPAGSQASSLSFISILLWRFNLSLKVSERDPLLASKSSPIHGILHALCECLSFEGSSTVLSPKDWQDVLVKTVTLCTSTATLMLDILAGGQSALPGNCPSFAQMSIALRELLSGDGTTEQEALSSNSPEFQLLLSWCWLNLKESCTCLGTVVSLAIQDRSKNVTLPVDMIEDVGNTFFKVLTDCRHRGAIEECRNGFLQFCTSLLSCDNIQLSAIPANILNRVFNGLEKDEMTSSVTRRSAGLPIIVQTILQAEKRCKSKNLLQEAVTRLYRIASVTTSDEADQTQDQMPVHALNILKAIFNDSSLSGDLLNHLGKMVELVIRSFESSSWAVRNAATQLISTLLKKMFGQRNKTSLTCNMMTLQEWSTHFPELLTFVSEKLRDVIQQGDTITAIQPSLFLVLTLLASLGPAAVSSQCHSSTSTLHGIVLDVVSSPVYFLRELSATAAVALTPLDATETFVEEQLGHLKAGSLCNRCHGILLCLEKLLTSRTLSQNMAEMIVNHALNNRILVNPTELSPFVCAKYVDVLSKAVPLLQPGSNLKSRLLESLIDSLVSLSSAELQVGRTLFLRSATSLIITLLSSSTITSSTSLQEFAGSCLISDDAELRSALLDCIPQNQEILCQSDSHGSILLVSLWQHLESETDASCMISICKLLSTYHLRQPSLPIYLDIHSIDMDTLRTKFGKLANVRAQLFPLEAIVLSQQIQCSEMKNVSARLISELSEWSSHLLEFSQASQNEDFRLAAAQGLSLAGQTIMSFCSRSAGNFVDAVVVSLVEACLLLLEETDYTIRKVVTCFVGNLQWEEKFPKISSMNANLCLKVFLTYVSDEHGELRAIHELLFRKLYTPGDLSTCLHKLTQPRAQYLFEPEENSFFSEKILLQQVIFKALVSQQTRNDRAVVSSGTLPELLAELKASLPVIQSSAAKEAVFNMSGEVGVITAVVGLVMQVLLISAGQKHQVNDAQHSTAEMPAELADLFQIQNLHPAVSNICDITKRIFGGNICFTDSQDQFL